MITETSKVTNIGFQVAKRDLQLWECFQRGEQSTHPNWLSSLETNKGRSFKPGGFPSAGRALGLNVATIVPLGYSTLSPASNSQPRALLQALLQSPPCLSQNKELEQVHSTILIGRLLRLLSPEGVQSPLGTARGRGKGNTLANSNPGATLHCNIFRYIP